MLTGCFHKLAALLHDSKENAIQHNLVLGSWCGCTRKPNGFTISTTLKHTVHKNSLLAVVPLKLFLAMSLLYGTGALLRFLLVYRSVDQLHMTVGLGDPRRRRRIGSLVGGITTIGCRSRLSIENQSLVAIGREGSATSATIASTRIRGSTIMGCSGRGVRIFGILASLMMINNWRNQISFHTRIHAIALGFVAINLTWF